MRIKYLFIYLIFIIFTTDILAQNFTQNIRGTVIDKESKAYLQGVSVVAINDSGRQFGFLSDENGGFRFEKLPLGRYQVKVFMVGYNPFSQANVTLNTGKESVLNIELEESLVNLSEIEVLAIDKAGTVNDLSMVSTRTFSLDETERYAASRQDPARMASNFAGVQGTDDSRNDIVIRGNSPLGLLWRLEDVDIPNPSHFAVSGSTGGPVSILNNKYLGTSDFMTGAFPSGYGNALSGVFDLKMRTGNTEKREYTMQFGVLGAEAATEGPFKKGKRASYLVTARYSTLEMLKSLRVPIGTDAVPKYGDAGFKIMLPTQKYGNISIFGIGGGSSIDIVNSKSDTLPQDLYGPVNRDQYFRTYMGVVGVSHAYSWNSSSFTKLTLSSSLQRMESNHNLIARFNETGSVTGITPILASAFDVGKFSASWFINKKISNRITLKTGFLGDMIHYNLLDSVRLDGSKPWLLRWDYKGSAFLWQPYAVLKFRLNEKLTLTTGLHFTYFSLNNNSYSPPEPRMGLKWQFNPKMAISVGYGLHSQTQLYYAYFQKVLQADGSSKIINQNMGLSQSQHFIATYDYVINRYFRIKAEAYYQNLWNVPVTQGRSSFSLLNQGSGFSRTFSDSVLVNKGTGENYGIELTVEKFYSKSYFFLVSMSLFDSKYKGSDGISRNTDFNGVYASNLLVGKEFIFGKNKNNTISLGLKLTLAGGRRYGPPDIAASNAAQELVYDDANRNSKQFRDYFRCDLRIGYKINAKKITHEIVLDLINLTRQRNLLALSYTPNPDPNKTIKESPQLGFLPLLYYKIDF